MTDQPSVPPPAPQSLPGTPATGDPGIDATLAQLAACTPEDLDGVLAAGEQTHRGLSARLGGAQAGPPAPARG